VISFVVLGSRVDLRILTFPLFYEGIEYEDHAEAFHLFICEIKYFNESSDSGSTHRTARRPKVFGTYTFAVVPT
jgi:hypothetical protein